MCMLHSDDDVPHADTLRYVFDCHLDNKLIGRTECKELHKDREFMLGLYRELRDICLLYTSPSPRDS